MILTELKIKSLIRKIISEGFLEEPKFFRFTNDEMLGIEDGVYKPRSRKLNNESPHWNSKLIGYGFPDMGKCIFLMDEIGYRKYGEKKYKDFGNVEYEITLDGTSILGWSFFVMQGKWYSKNPNTFTKYYTDYKLPEELENNKDFKKWDYDIQINPSIDKYVKLLLKHKVIGRGTINDLISSPFWGEVPCYVWTEDKVKINKI
jgi:hypothetical protein